MNPRIFLLFLLSILFTLSGSVRSAPAPYLAPELVVAVAQWRLEGGPEQDIQENTYQRLQQRLSELPLQNVSLIKIPTVLQNAAEVDRIAEQFGADIIVWGWYDETGVRGYVDLANSMEDNGMANSLAAFLRKGGSTESIRVLDVLSGFDYYEDGVYFCVPRWSP